MSEVTSPLTVGVTGSSGKLGRATVARLRGAGHEVIGFDLAGSPGPGFTRVDLADYGQTLDALLGVTARHGGVDALVHLAAIPVNGLVPDVTTFTSNVTATFHTFFAAHRVGIRKIVYASSITAMGFPFDEAPPSLPVDETFTRAHNTYGLGKVAEEAIAAQLVGWAGDASITALRFTNVVDESEYDTFARADDVTYRRDLLGSWIDARDGAEAVALALEKAQPGFDAFNVAAPESGLRIPSRELAETWFPGTPLAEDLGRFESLMSTRKIQELWGFRAQHDWR
ncbi:nucleoside-diphosphate-sugar epimerase [Microbacterium halimionae]|uniref:Nucleoside-diphosphate-sugar epimerase n=1 Tax=Microbacterium halimionae TaxID=1526413 RepID=A0A7W3PKI6_9MICO|nr:NAD(P)-dependent oxidoreductase [Microbacterium halimionae]MBA8815158.1 nucleoside-diphosphate-sugar epimerase [Microbacterium halimionae]NII94051.1 nucleoside-diphosphate-sugar epimerase [Microbacterium halimionae]